MDQLAEVNKALDTLIALVEKGRGNFLTNAEAAGMSVSEYDQVVYLHYKDVYVGTILRLTISRLGYRDKEAAAEIVQMLTGYYVTAPVLAERSSNLLRGHLREFFSSDPSRGFELNEEQKEVIRQQVITRLLEAIEGVQTWL